MKKYLLAVLLAAGFMIAGPTMAAGHTISDKIHTGTFGDAHPSIDLEPMIGSAIGAAFGGGSGQIALAAAGALVGDVVDDDEIDLGTMVGGGVGAAVGGPLGAAVGAMLGDLFTDFLGHKHSTTHEPVQTEEYYPENG